jgi:hypothetical protein
LFFTTSYSCFLQPDVATVWLAWPYRGQDGHDSGEGARRWQPEHGEDRSWGSHMSTSRSLDQLSTQPVALSRGKTILVGWAASFLKPPAIADATEAAVASEVTPEPA